MIVQIIREACCSQDDQLGPLEIQLEFDENATLEQVIKEICRLKFLQYSSSHNHMIGRTDDQKIVEILLPQEEVIFHLQKDSLVKKLITENGLSFSFINSIFDIKDKTITGNKSNECLKKRSFLQNLIFGNKLLFYLFNIMVVIRSTLVY